MNTSTLKAQDPPVVLAFSFQLRSVTTQVE